MRGTWTTSSPGGLLAPAGISGGSVAPATRLARAALGGVLLTGALVAAGAPGTPSLLPESIRPVPASLAGPFGGTGLQLHVGGAIAVLMLMLASYTLVVALADRLDARSVITTIGLLHLLILLAPPLVSTDIFSYEAYARMGARYGINPYLNGPTAIRLDGIFPYVGARWSSTPSVYGPLFTAGSYLLAPASVAASVVAEKSVATAASLGLVALVWRCARRRSVEPVRAVALVGLNPLLVVYGVGGGHNDLLMLLALGGSLAMLLARRDALGGALAVLAIAIKLTGGLLLPFALAAGGARRGRAARHLLGPLAALTLAGGLSLALFGLAPLHLLETLRQTQGEGDWLSLTGAVGHELGLPRLARVLGGALLAGFLLLSAWLLVAVWRGTVDWIDAAGWATLALLVASSTLLPWYVAWLLPLTALARDPRLRPATLTVTAIVQIAELLGTLPHG